MATSKRKRWSQRVTQTSNALDLDQGVFSKSDARSIARVSEHAVDGKAVADPVTVRRGGRGEDFLESGRHRR